MFDTTRPSITDLMRAPSTASRGMINVFITYMETYRGLDVFSPHNTLKLLDYTWLKSHDGMGPAIQFVLTNSPWVVHSCEYFLYSQ